jgi:LPXTG-site transpeptidase (sortase) family protein
MDSSSNKTYPFPDPQSKDDTKRADNDSTASNLIRGKIDNIHTNAPSAAQEIKEIKAEDEESLSPHQKFIEGLNKSGKSRAEIQSAWNNYYLTLSDAQKHEVWNEFYSAHKLQSPLKAEEKPEAKVVEIEQPKPEKAKSKSRTPRFSKPTKKPAEGQQTVAEIKSQLLSKIESRKPKRILALSKSLIFGLSCGAFTIIILLFGFFNDRFIAPFITPSRNVSAQSLILNPSSIQVGPNPIIIIPKINVQIPVVYNAPNINSDTIETALESGVVHYPTTPYPGQLGNGVIFGHSSNNILNPGQYKFAFVLLHDLTDGDTFYLEYQSKLYVYQVINTQVVSPNDTQVLETQSKPATMTLITCDPPGTSINRLIILGEQISPDPSTDTASSVNPATEPKPAILPSNSPTLWSRLIQDIGL